MTKREFGLLSSAIKTIYPSELPNSVAMDLWYQTLSFIPYDVAVAAFAEWIKHSHFAPKPSDFIDFAAKSISETLTDDQYFAKVKQYITAVEKKELPESKAN